MGAKTAHITEAGARRATTEEELQHFQDALTSAAKRIAYLENRRFGKLRQKKETVTAYVNEQKEMSHSPTLEMTCDCAGYSPVIVVAAVPVVLVVCLLPSRVCVLFIYAGLKIFQPQTGFPAFDKYQDEKKESHTLLQDAHMIRCIGNAYGVIVRQMVTILHT